MAKRKTKKKETQPKNQNINLAGTQTLNYQGSVTIKLNHGKKTVLSKTYHNAGMPSLFKFLATALAGNYSEALRPCKIKLFYWKKADDYNLSPKDFDWITAFNEAVPPSNVSTFVTYDNTPKVDREEITYTKDGNSYTDTQYKTTLHFRVPFALIAGDKINLIGLYPSNSYVGTEKDPSAYYLLANDDGTKWEALDLENIEGNYSIIIDWTMAVLNKQTAINTAN